MALIEPKLNLNRTPSIVDNNSMVFAKNIRADVDGTIHRDYSITPLNLVRDGFTDDGFAKHIDYINLLRHAIKDLEYYATNSGYATDIDVYNHYIDEYKSILSNWRIVDVIASNTEFYIFIYGSYKEEEDKPVVRKSFIIKYDEKTGKYSPCNCNWNWSGGNITGCVINNLVGDKLIIIGESEPKLTKLVPLKCINITKSSYLDDETIYTQTPNIPYTNLKYAGKFAHTVPNGVYQFFIRYKIRDNFYTDWFLASRDIFIGNQYNTSTTFGTIQYINTNVDSDNSVILDVQHVLKDHIKNYKSFQIGYILSHDDAVLARAWKHFDMETTKVYFDFKEQDIEEINVTDLTKTTYQLYNVANVTNFKNKVYVSNYTETDFNENDNEEIENIANNITIEIGETQKKEGTKTYKENKIDSFDTSNDTYIKSVEVYTEEVTDYKDKNKISGEKGLISNLLKTGADNNIRDMLMNIFSFDENVYANASPETIYPNTTLFDVQSSGETFAAVKGERERELRQYENENATKPTAVRYIKFDDANNAQIHVTYDNAKSDNELILNKKDYTKAEDIVNKILEYIYTNTNYFNSKGEFVDLSLSVIDTFKISIIRDLSYENLEQEIQKPSSSWDDVTGNVTGPTTGPNTGTTGPTTGTTEVKYVWKLKNESYIQHINISFSANPEEIDVPDVTLLTNCTTLIPHQYYKFYVHFIKSNGEITNGYECKKAGEIKAPHKEECNTILYPKFSNIQIPTGYDGCFFSILHTAVNVATIANIKNYTYEDTDKQKHTIGIEGVCFDINTMLLPMFKTFNVIGTSSNGKEVNAIGNYYYSGNSDVVRYFGADGVVTIKSDDESIASEYIDDTNVTVGKIAYALDDFRVSDKDENNYLIKCTPYYSRADISAVNKPSTGVQPMASVDIPTNRSKVIEDYENYELKGYICTLYPLSREVSTELYTDGSTMLYKLNPEETGNDYRFKEVSNKDNKPSGVKDLLSFNLRITHPVSVYSNYNLNFLGLVEEPKLKINTYYPGSSSSSGSSDSDENGTKPTNDESMKFIARLFSSLTLSSIYTLPKMYKQYTRKNYIIKYDTVTSRFDNTIRSSLLEGDENSIDVFRFDPNDYYNVPADKGKIVNLVGVGDMIIAHTQDTMYRFTGANTLSPNDGEIKVNETDPFDTGIAEVFGSDFGYAGIQDKKHSILSEYGYIFFDKDANVIYAYSGQGQITKITDSIEKLMRYDKIKDVYFANDYYNNRFFVRLLFENNASATLSFNIREQVKQFISLHDFNFVKAFNTKTNCYFISNDNSKISKVDKTSTGLYHDLLSFSSQIYPYKEGNSWIRLSTIDNALVQRTEVKFGYSMIDVINNQNYETIKTLDYIEWCSRFIKSEFAEVNNDNLNTLKMADILEDEIPCFYLRVYTDSCMTKLIEIDDKRSNNVSISDPNSYQYARYNQGKFTLNYFRNIQNANDRFNYLENLNDGRNGAEYRSDNNSLIEGKYFVARFLFDKDFKFESIDFNYKNKI